MKIHIPPPLKTEEVRKKESEEFWNQIKEKQAREQALKEAAKIETALTDGKSVYLVGNIELEDTETYEGQEIFGPDNIFEDPKLFHSSRKRRMKEFFKSLFDRIHGIRHMLILLLAGKDAVILNCEIGVNGRVINTSPNQIGLIRNVSVDPKYFEEKGREP